MTDKLAKAIAKLSAQEKAAVQLLLLRIRLGDTFGLDIKQLRGYDDLFRVRKGRLRVIYLKNATKFKVVRVDLRDNKTYKGL